MNVAYPAIRKLHRTVSTLSTADDLFDREWLVTNGLGGYACSSLAGVPTRRFHALLVAALPAPLGRCTVLNRLTETLILPSGERHTLGGEEGPSGAKLYPGSTLTEFCLELGLPMWRFEVGPIVLEKRVMMVHKQNTVHVSYTLIAGPEGVQLELQPWLCFRPHEGKVQGPTADYRVNITGEHCEVVFEEASPVLRLEGSGAPVHFEATDMQQQLRYRVEQSRGYDFEGSLQSPCKCTFALGRDTQPALTASTELWAAITPLTTPQAFEAERARRLGLLQVADRGAREGVGAELVLAADQFIITPATRREDMAVAEASGDAARTVIAGYHWFTDWGRDTMISLEGLTLLTGRHNEARSILLTFAHYVRDGLIPNMFPEGQSEGLYHTADASLWFFHAVHRYVSVTGDKNTLERVLPALREIMDAHLRGTRFGIGVDPGDGLLRQGQAGYQLTWMDAKVDDWVVTPRRGKAVEINALFYNALKLFSGWVTELDGPESARPYHDAALRVREAFNLRFWNAEKRYLYDVVDGEAGDDDACRPNQLLAISLTHPVLDEARFGDVLSVCEKMLLTPVGLRSLSPDHPDYKARYFGDLRTRDAAYHQGTVWAWLIGPYADAWLKVHPGDVAGLSLFLSGLTAHLDDACVGSISEVFDAEAPYTARGCVAQAWSVAEFLRCWLMVNHAKDSVHGHDPG